MKLAAGRVDAFLAAPDPAVRAALLYGPDSGLVRERAARLVAAVAPPDDPFRIAELTAATLREDPARLADEAAALALTGGRRVVRLREATDGTSGPLGDYLAGPVGEALIVVEAGDLGPRSSLRKLFEGATEAAAIPCYGDSERDLAEVVRKHLAAEGLVAEHGAMEFLLANLGGDRQLTRRELEKLVLYCGGEKGGRRAVTVDDVVACVGDSAAMAMDDVVLAAADGDFAALDRALARVTREGASPVAVLRAALRHVQRLHLVAARVATGTRVSQAVQGLAPPVFFKHRPRLEAQLGWWSEARLRESMGLLLDAEGQCKRTGLPAEAIAGRALMAMANAAVRGRRATRR